MLDKMFKSIIDMDREPVVISDLSHVIVYMNPAAVKRYKKYGGAKLLGSNLLDCHSKRSADIILNVVEWFGKSPLNNIIHTTHEDDENLDVYMVALRDGDELIGYYEKHESRNLEEASPYDFSRSL